MKLTRAMMAGETEVSKSAVLSPCKTYRYRLDRQWGCGSRRVVWIGLNPSTADHTIDDPTIRRMMSISRANDGADAITVVNLYAVRSPDPQSIRAYFGDPVGRPETDRYIMEAIGGATRVVVCWGAHPVVGSRHLQVLRMVESPYCLGYTKGGYPRHPLYVRADTPFEPYNLGHTAASLRGAE